MITTRRLVRVALPAVAAACLLTGCTAGTAAKSGADDPKSSTSANAGQKGDVNPNAPTSISLPPGSGNILGDVEDYNKAVDPGEPLPDAPAADGGAVEPADEGGANASQPTVSGTGTYRVGAGIAPGTYYAENSGGYCYYARYRTTTPDPNAMIYSNFSERPLTVTIGSGDKLFETEGCEGGWSPVVD